MKLKHVLFSSLLLSTGFVACTNEDITEISAPVNTSEGISLGEGYTIVGGKATDATSRAYVKDDLSASLWETTDIIGAAWYDMVTAIDEEGNVTAHEDFSSKFASNIWFKWSKQVGSDMSLAEFTSEANAMAGAYVLYYPYDETLTTSFDGIPVKVSNSQTMDCTAGKELDGVNDNLFAYTVYPFVPGGSQTAEFKMNQLPNIFKLQFQVKKANLMKLENPVKIAKVIVEAVDASGSVLYEEGSIKPATVTDYKTLAGLGKAEYAEDEEKVVSNLILDVKNAGSDYTIAELGTPTVKPFYIAALPFSDPATAVTIKILTEDGEVYQKVYNSTTQTTLDAINKQATDQGKLISLTVTLDDLSDEGTIYTAGQFKTQWNAALTSTDPVTLTIGDGVDLSDVDLKLDKNVNVTLAGKSLNVKSLEATAGSLTINNELTVAGNVTIDANATLKTGNEGVLSVEGDMNVVGSAGTVKVAKLGKLEISKVGVITIEGENNAKDENPELSAVTNYGKLTLKNVKVKDLTNEGSVTVADTKVSNEGTITNNGTFTLSADFENNGTFNQNKIIDGTGAFNNNAGATLNVNASFETQDAVAINNAAANVKDNLPAAVINVAKDKTLTVNAAKKLTNNGIINVNGTIAEGSGALVQNTADARINVASTGSILINQTSTGVTGGYVMIVKGSTVNDTGNKCAVVATEVTATTKAEDINTAADVYMMKGNFTDTQISTHTGKNLVFTGGTITLNETAVTLTGKATIAGDVTLALASDEASQRTFTISDTYGMTINAGAKLTIGEDVTLAGSSSATLTVEKGGSLVNNGELSKITVNQ